LICIVADQDSVVEVWADVFLGLDENEALRLSTDWRKTLNHPRLQNDGLEDRFFDRGNLLAERYLSITTAHKIKFWSQATSGIKAHADSHSRRMGSLVGDLIRRGPKKDAIAFLNSLVQPPEADDGGPVPESEHLAWQRRNAVDCVHMGWRLSSADIKLHSRALELERAKGFGDPDPYLCIEQQGAYQETPTRSGVMKTDWQDTDIIVRKMEQTTVSVRDDNGLFEERDLGGEWFWPPGYARNSQSTRKSYKVDLDEEFLWEGVLDWVPVHY